MKKLTILAAAALALAMTGAGALAETTLQLGTTVNEQDSFQVAAEKFAELVEERTNGEYKIEIYPNGTLGGESDMLDSMSTGMLDMGIITSGPFVNFSEAMGVLDMPYLFANNEEAYKVFDGEIGRELLDSLEDAGLKGLAYAERGFRNVTNSVRPVNNADDLAGLKLRVMENEVYTATFKALKVNAVPMAWAEALTAMQQGTIEGQENPPSTLLANGWYEVQDYLAMTNHQIAMNFVLFNEDFYNSMSAEDQAVVDEACEAFVQKQLELFLQAMVDDVETLQEYGLEVTYPDREEMKAAGSGVIDEYREEYPEFDDIMTKIEVLQEEYRANSADTADTAGAAADAADAGTAETADAAA